jgi:hypothetical protein
VNSYEKTLARIMFKNKVNGADGNAFEDLFTAIMNYAEPGFQQIKPWANIGDRKNDGYIPGKGIYYQVFAPEDIKKSYPKVVAKLVNDFDGLKTQWSPINEFYFVVNDKFNGVNADTEKAIKKMKGDHNLRHAAFLTAKDMENMLFKLADDKIQTIVGFLPDPEKMSILNYGVLNEVIGHIMKLPIQKIPDGSYVAPDWDKKIAFNGLTSLTAHYLGSAYFQVGDLEVYLKNNGDFLAQELKDRITQLYISEKEKTNGDGLFMEILLRLCPDDKLMYKEAALVIMAKYFEACDIFEEPPE